MDEYAVSGMGLFMAYNDGDGLSTKYYIGEGGDIIMAKNKGTSSGPTGFEYDECTSTVEFNDVDYPQLANATLITVLSEYAFHTPITNYKGKPYCDLLRFNVNDVEKPLTELNGDVHYWKYHTVGDIALRKNELWGERGDYVDVQGSNLAAIQSRGSYFFLTNVFLNVTYPPDLEPSVPMQLKATAGTSYNIPITIHNWGKSKARDFNVTVSIDGNKVLNETIPEIKEAGQDGSSITKNIPRKAPPVEGIIEFNVTVVVDPENTVNELINKYRRGNQRKSNGEENNIWNDTVTVVVKPSGWDLLGKGGGGGTGGGWGEGTGTGEGSGSGAGKGVAGGTGEGAGQSSGKAIRGRLMKGTCGNGR